MRTGQPVLHHALMRSATARLLAPLLPILTALAASTLLLVDYMRGVPVICAEGGGCDAIKRTPFAHVLGIPTPAFGVVAFLVVGVLALLKGERARQLFGWAAVVVGAVGGTLLALQARLGTFCVFCVITDVSALLTLASSVLFRGRGAPPAPEPEAPPPGSPEGHPYRPDPLPARPAWRLAREAGAAALVLAFVVPLVIALTKRPMLPPVIAEQLAKAPKGQVVIVDFADFECPYCRMTHEELEPLLESHKGKVHLVRELVPLTRIHPHALDAARAACCGEAQGKGDAMANALFAAPVDDLTMAGCEKIAASLGLDVAAYKACVLDPKTDARIHADRETFDKAAAKVDGLPLMWIGEKKLMGAQDRETLERALDEAIARAGS